MVRSPHGGEGEAPIFRDRGAHLSRLEGENVDGGRGSPRGMARGGGWGLCAREASVRRPVDLWLALIDLDQLTLCWTWDFCPRPQTARRNGARENFAGRGDRVERGQRRVNWSVST